MRLHVDFGILNYTTSRKRYERSLLSLHSFDKNFPNYQFQQIITPPPPFILKLIELMKGQTSVLEAGHKKSCKN